MDLFTIDTVGQQTFLGEEESRNSEILYSYNNNENVESEHSDNDTQSNSEIEDAEDDYDYGGK